MSENDKDAPELDLDDVLNTEVERKSSDAKGADRPEYADGIDFEVADERGDVEEAVNVDAGNALNADKPESKSGGSKPEYEGGIDFDPSDERSGFQDSADDLQQLLDYVAEEYGEKPISVDDIDVEGGVAVNAKSDERQR
ncbi:MAG: hypothetical protein K6L76_01725 [Agarilytica sp.]